MKSNFIHVCFVIDESGSMIDSIDTIKNGYKEIIEEQKNIKDGTCAVSIYRFNSKVTCNFIGKDVNELSENLEYYPNGMTAMNDGIGTAIDSIGKWLDSMKEEDKPESNLIVIMTDGYENSSTDYTLTKVKEMIKHQTEKYNWVFTYVGADITDSKTADDLGVGYKIYSTKNSYKRVYSALNTVVSSARMADNVNDDIINTMYCASADLNADFEKETGNKMSNV